MTKKSFKEKFKNLFKKAPSPKGVADDLKGGVKEVADDVSHKVKESEERIKRGVSGAYKASEDAVKKSVEKTGEAVKALHLKDKPDDGSSTKATYAEGKHSALGDQTTPWFRRWYMFAFLYPVIISFLLEWLRRSA